MSVQPIVLRCSCCGLPFGHLLDGSIIVESRHHGEKHVNVVRVEDIAKLRPEVRPDERREAGTR